MGPTALAIGIDLGTANTCVAVYRGGHVEIIPDDGCQIMPSYVAFTETGRLIGAAARNQVDRNPRNTIFDALRFIGRKFSDPEIQHDMKFFPFVTSERGGKFVLRVEYRGRTIYVTPEEILSMILTKAKENAETYLGFTVESAVITTPSYFTTFQRQSLRDVARVSGLNVLYLISGPTAAVIPYTLDHWSTDERKLLVVDLGAGTCDVTVASIEEGIIEVRSMASDNHLGGEDFDNRLVNFCFNEFMRIVHVNGKMNEASIHARSLRRLRTACERAKRELVSQQQTHVQVDSLQNGINFHTTVTGAKFEELCSDLFRSVLVPIEIALREAKIGKDAVHELILVGGSSRIPRVQRVISQFFNGKEVSKSLNLDEAAASGAAIFAAVHSGYARDGGPKLHELLLLDATAFDLGIEVAKGFMLPLIKRNTTLPAKKSKIVSIAVDDQQDFPISDFTISVIEGNRIEAIDNNQLGKFSFPHSRGPKGVSRIEITFECSIHGISSVTAFERDTGSKRVKNFHLNHIGQLSTEDIERMQTDAKNYKADEQAEADRVSERNGLESYAYSFKRTIPSYNLEASKAQRLTRQANSILDWLYENQSVKAAVEYRLRRAELNELFVSLTLGSSASGATQSDLHTTLLDRGKGKDRGRSPSGDGRGSTDASLVEVAESSKSELRASAYEHTLAEKHSSSHPSNLLHNTTQPISDGRTAEAIILPDEPIDASIEGNPTDNGHELHSAASLWLPLGPKEFRLLHRTGSGELQLKLKSHKIEYPPRYRALSHVWGTQPKDRTLVCTNWDESSRASLKITEPLHNALSELAVEGTPIWVDTVCIDQTNPQEKSKQVALMHRIYRRADQVAIWLDRQRDNTALALNILTWISMPPALGSEDKSMELFPALKRHLGQSGNSLQVEQLQRLASVASKSQHIPITPNEFQRKGLPQFDDHLWKALGAVFSPPWLFRLWTFQELMLGKDCFVAFGNTHLPWRTYFDVGMQLSLCGLLDHCNANLEGVPEWKTRASTAFTRIAPFLSTRQRIVPFWRYLDEARHRDVMEPVDRVYAVLSLANETLRSKIKVDYSEDYKARYWELFVDVGKAVMMGSTMQAVLAGANSKTKARELPSWCPDFTVPCEVISFGAKAQAGLRFGKSLAPHYDRMVISAGGAKMDKVTHIVPFSWTWPRAVSEIYGPYGLAAQNLKWLDTCWSYTREAYMQNEAGAHRAFVLTVLGKIPPSQSLEGNPLGSDSSRRNLSTGLHAATPDASSIDAWFDENDDTLIDLRRRLENLRICAGPEDSEESPETWHRFQAISKRLDDIWRNRAFFTTGNGRIGFASDRIRPGDHVCLFFGESHMYILRDRPAGFYQFVSDAYVDGYMAGEGCENLPDGTVFKLN